MKLFKLAPGIVAILAFAVLVVHAQGSSQPPQPPKYKLELVRVFDYDVVEYFFVVGRVGFRNVASLKKFVGDLPPGSILEWDPGCLRYGHEPLLSSKAEMDDFKAFCIAEEINFVIVPAG